MVAVSFKRIRFTRVGYDKKCRYVAGMEWNKVNHSDNVRICDSH